jgi:hypothetical protein
VPNLVDFDEHGEGSGRGRDAGQDREPVGGISIGLKLLEDRGLDRRDPVFSMVEALRILALQQRCGEIVPQFLATCGLSPRPRERGQAP